MNSDNSIIGKIILINEKSYKIFSYGHRNPQGLFYDKENDIIFETEHGPTGGDEINLIREGKHYGWPSASYGAKIDKLNKYRNHKKNNFTEPLKYWWQEIVVYQKSLKSMRVLMRIGMGILY